MRKNCSSDREKLLKFEAEGQEFSKNLRSLEQFIKILGFKNLQEKLEKECCDETRVVQIFYCPAKLKN